MQRQRKSETGPVNSYSSAVVALGAAFPAASTTEIDVAVKDAPADGVFYCSPSIALDAGLVLSYVRRSTAVLLKVGIANVTAAPILAAAAITLYTGEVS